MQRGIRDGAIGIGVALTAIFLPWAAIGLDGIDRYVSVVHDVTTDRPTYALPWALGITVAAFALAGMWIRRTDPIGSFSLSLLAMLAATPVLWGLYFSVVLLPLALLRPRFSIVWLIPFVAAWAEGRLYAGIFFSLLVWCGLGAPRIHRRIWPASRVTPHPH